MGREVRMVPKDWKHPVDEQGNHVGLFEGGFSDADNEWNEGYEKWKQGLCRSYSYGEQWRPIDKEDAEMRYTDYSGSRPSPDDYMPEWTQNDRTHLQMYETCSEGSPISPVMETPEQLAQWLSENNASSFGRSTATYEQWLTVCKGGYAPSVVISGGVLMSGVESLSEEGLND